MTHVLTILQVCDSNPCKNNAYCCQLGTTGCPPNIPAGQFRCFCANGYTGSFCQTEVDLCSFPQCAENGRCINTLNSFECECAVGYTGSRCEINIPCTPDPCVFGSCQTVGNDYQCLCDEGYTGINCDVEIQPCDSSPCLQGGECVSDGDSFTCNCPQFYTGQFCETLITPCDSNPCLNGLCNNIDNVAYVCNCYEGFTGMQCERRILPCDIEPCENGVCVNLVNTYRCDCDVGFRDRNCSTKILPCDAQPCGFGTCMNVNDTHYSCMCDGGYTGDNCDFTIPPLPCDSNPCMNGGACENGGFESFACTCPAGFGGETCEVVIPPPCQSNPCENGGLCSNNGFESFTCLCAFGYNGTTCGNRIPFPCESFPCQNGATCYNNGFDLYRCVCDFGFTGPNCELTIPLPCESDPCMNGATCLNDGYTSFSCQCSEGFEGNLCQTEIPPPCESDPCQNGATCTNDGFESYVCLCLDGFGGPLCENAIPRPCASNPCQNGAPCIDNGFESFDCDCPAGFRGARCEEVIPIPCQSDPCLNGATCQNNGFESFMCTCPEEYEGTRCETRSPFPCESDPCTNGAGCINDGFEAFICQCQPDFTGTFCETPLPCFNSPCRNGATCVNNDGPSDDPFTCQCTSDFTGQFCETPSPCLSSPCLSSGTCVNNAFQSYSCLCPADYTGLRCETPSPCLSDPCLNGATCTDDNFASFACDCAPGFGGTRCENEIPQPCESNPCLNGGSCTDNGLESFSCTCPVGFDGPTCAVVIPTPCDSNPCLNSASCQDNGLESYTCICQPGFEGERCENEIPPPCLSDPCSNGATCVENGFESFSCDCPPGFFGETCEIELNDPCDSDPCQNGAMCRSDGDNVQCECVAGYTGTFCGETVTSCDQEPCRNDGQCFEDSIGPFCFCPNGVSGIWCEFAPGVCYPVNPCQNGGICWPDGDRAYCQCQPGFFGDFCEQTEVECGPCVNGDCVTGLDGGFECRCPSNYVGSRCEFPNPCTIDPCQNGAPCVPNDADGSFSCACPEGFSGTLCDVTELLGCASLPCQNGATCSDVGDNSYTCTCSSGYTGRDCETDIDECSSQPCQNGASCQNLDGGFNCVCPATFSGPLCEFFVPCGSGPCLNGATCQNTPNSAHGTAFTCICPQDFGGALCEVQDFCGASPCPPGVPCLNLQDTFECDFCSNDVCDNGATCMLSPSSSVGYECLCPLGFTGQDCSVEVDECLPTSCSGRGSCSNLVRCVNGYSCVCDPGYSGDECEISSCDGLVCGFGTCLVEDDGNAVCRCELGVAGTGCNIFVDSFVPHFAGTSYMRYELPSSSPVLNELVLDLQFRAQVPDGLLLYSEQASGQGDFFALSLKFGRVEFEFDLGGGVTTVSSDPVPLDTWTEVSVRRVGRSAQMNVTGQSTKTAEATGSLQSLNVQPEVFVGGVNDFSTLSSRIGVTEGLSGCILSLSIQGIEFSFNRSAAIEVVDVAQCSSDVCETQPCLNGATCQSQPGSTFFCECPPGYRGDDCGEEVDACMSGEAQCGEGSTCVLDGDSFRCLCPLGKTGTLCEDDQDLDNLVPSFSGLSYLTYPPLVGVSQEMMVNVRIRPASVLDSALILYVEDSLSSSGDYLALGVSDGALQLRFNLGSGTAVITSEVVSAGQWHNVTVIRSGNTAQLTVDGVTTDFVGSGSVGLTVNSPVYVGGVDEYSMLHSGVGFLSGFQGCMEHLEIGGASVSPLTPSMAVSGADISQCEHSACTSEACLNGATCQSVDAFTFQCLCTSGWRGATCEEAETFTVPHFSPSSYLAFNSSSQVQYFSSVTMEIRPDGREGILFWNSEGGDFFGVGLVAGRVHFTFDLGTGPSTIVSDEEIVIGQWHIVTVARINGEGRLWLDDAESPVVGNSSGSSVGLSMGTTTHLGGVAQGVDVPSRAGISGGFSGCMRRVTVNQLEVDLTNVVASSGISQCQDSICNLDHGCENGDGCLATGSSSLGYQCQCNPGYSGFLCNISSCDLLPANQQCQNNGECYVNSDGQASCLCRAGLGGTDCTAVASYSIPMFSGRSYLSFGREVLASVFSSNMFRIVLRPLDASENVLLLWHGASVHSDFMALGIQGQHLTLLFNLGSGLGLLEVNDIEISSGLWYSVDVNRAGTQATMTVQSLSPSRTQTVTGSSPGTQSGLATFDLPVYLGGHPDDITELTNGYFSSGFQGCVGQFLTALNPSGNLQVVNLVTQRTGGLDVRNCNL
ncbi:uncharacterized protein [Diadema setosum]|uniref:uncharacterized protein n=1 Tax=Diadema setosum TaxID=31175 RepID=UPI003B3B55B3